MGYSDGSHESSVSINDVSTRNHLGWDMEGHKVTGVRRSRLNWRSTGDSCNC